jgi:hypothetical protein
MLICTAVLPEAKRSVVNVVALSLRSAASRPNLSVRPQLCQGQPTWDEASDDGSNSHSIERAWIGAFITLTTGEQRSPSW